MIKSIGIGESTGMGKCMHVSIDIAICCIKVTIGFNAIKKSNLGGMYRQSNQSETHFILSL